MAHRVTAYLQEDVSAVRELLQECLHIREEIGERYGIALALCNLGNVVREQGDYPLAQSLLAEGLTLFRELENRTGTLIGLEGVAAVMLRLQKTQTAVLLLGAAAALRQALAMPQAHYNQIKYAQQIEEARQLLGDDAFDLLWAKGLELSSEQAVATALTA